MGHGWHSHLRPPSFSTVPRPEHRQLHKASFMIVFHACSQAAKPFRLIIGKSRLRHEVRMGENTVVNLEGEGGCFALPKDTGTFNSAFPVVRLSDLFGFCPWIIQWQHHATTLIAIHSDFVIFRRPYRHFISTNVHSDRTKWVSCMLAPSHTRGSGLPNPKVILERCVS
ncbi:hypothetical protein BDN72DRAFT_127679 [Pluteus cervinus]|uniref:Uncharacterized protein n=1 Tax=Pluteus cervinus TaxID=181527 RepID=A0ACD3AMY7_9AGAR|nr:hypothetical protein BDN72DRAFT_127679 [Pluteus cervinus]